MNNELESIDKYLRSEIDDLEISPSEGVWDSIDSKIESKQLARNSRKMKLKILGAAVLVSGLTALVMNYYQGSSQQKPAVNDQPTLVEQKLVAPVQQLVTVETQPSNIETNKSSAHKNEVKETVSSSGNTTYLANSAKQDLTGKAEEDFAGMNDRQEAAVIKAKPVSSLVDSKKDVSDKAIILLPYFSANAANNTAESNKQSANNGSVKSDIVETTKPEPKENVIYMPNAFTPNGDGLNDVFLPQTADTPKEYKLSIFDRLGHLVFYSEDVLKGWDGQSMNNGSEEVKEDVYMWRIEMKNSKGEKEHLMGTLTLLK